WGAPGQTNVIEGQLLVASDDSRSRPLAVARPSRKSCRQRPVPKYSRRSSVTERGEDFSEALVHRLANAGRHQGPTVCLLVKGSDWRCRPIAVRRLALKLPD